MQPSNNKLGNKFYNYSTQDILELFDTDTEVGLSSEEVILRLERDSFNELPKIKKSLWKVYLSPIFNYLILILIITGIIIILLGSPEQTIITFTVVVVNSVTAVVQQYRAQKALESLKQISALEATVMREGVEIEIPTREVVNGDIIVLSQGDKVPADGRIISASSFSVDEAPLTGESEAMEKSPQTINESNIPLQKQTNMVFMGTYVKTGKAKIVVTNTGPTSKIGKISGSLNEMGSIEDIPLTHKLNRLAVILGTIVMINAIILIAFKLIVLFLSNSLIQSEIATAISDSIIRAMNLMPINLPLMTTLVLITGVLNMAQSGVIIKNLSAIESLGRVSVICSDKTGTITKNEMTVEKLWINNMEYEVSGVGYDSDGTISSDGIQLKINTNPTFLMFLDAIILNNNARLKYEDIKIKREDEKEIAVRKALGSPTEAALLVLSEKAGIHPYDIKNKYAAVYEFSFSSEIKRMTVICKSKKDDPEMYAFSKGAPERMLLICDSIETNDKIQDFTVEQKEKVQDLISKRAYQGYRTLAIAYKKLSSLNDQKREDIEKNLTFLGFVSIIDPPRAGVKKSVEESLSAGIKVVMITGDHPATAQTIAQEMGILKDNENVVEGSKIKALQNDEFDKTTVFARVEPSDKVVIVEKYQERGKVVSMTGDGINDTLALKLANAGIAMGITGTDVAKETADMVISDDNFSSIVRGVKIGRGLFAKIRTIIYFFICINIMEATIFFGYEFISVIQLFSSNWQQVYIYGILHSFPSLALVIDTLPKDIMKEPPRNDEQILNKNMWALLLIHAFLMGIGIVIVFQLSYFGLIPLNNWNIDPSLSYIPTGSTEEYLVHQKARTMFITTLYIEECFFVWSFRRPNMSLIRSIREEKSYSLLLICFFTIGLHMLLIIFSQVVNYTVNIQLGFDLPLNFLFLSLTDWLICIGLSLPGIFGIEFVKYFARKKKITF